MPITSLGCIFSTDTPNNSSGSIPVVETFEVIPCFDLLSAIKKVWSYSPVPWKEKHAQGHLDDRKHVSELYRWELLNIEMDKEAKVYIQVAKQNPRHYRIHSEPWSL
jgi:hypothetical protein